MSDKKKAILIIDDQPLFRERLSQLINHQPDMQVREEAQSVEQAIPLIRYTWSDLAIVKYHVGRIKQSDAHQKH
jgi:DNA-binding NarL/FixJ family response regulator